MGSNTNGGVHADNVNCRTGPTLGHVLQLYAHGDKYQGHGPVGVNHDSSPVPQKVDRATHWHNKGYVHDCAPHCDVQRVGASVTSKVAIKAGTVEVMMKPCPQFGAASTVFLISYQQVECGSPDKPNVQNNCPADYTKNCCIDGNCTINPNGKTGDVCRGMWVKNKEIDIEMPSSHVQGDAANDPKNINFGNFRFNSVQAVPWSYKHHTKCAILDRKNPDGTSACEDDEFVAINPAKQQNDGKFHKYTIEWDGKSVVKASIDGVLQKTITDFVPSVGEGELSLKLNIASWFPNSWAGSPDFSTCVTEVASVKITDAP